MGYAPKNWRIGRTPEWWKRFETHQNVKTQLCDGNVHFKQHPVYDETTHTYTHFDGRKSYWDETTHIYTDLNGGELHLQEELVSNRMGARFIKRNDTFEGIPIFGRAMNDMMKDWKRDYGTHLREGKPFFMRGGTTKYNFPVEHEDEDMEILYYQHTVEAPQDEYPDPEVVFPEDEEPRFGLHCRFDWFLRVGTWLNNLQCVWAVVSPTHQEYVPCRGCYTSDGLDGQNNGNVPIWAQVPNPYWPGEYDWDNTFPQFTSAGINYAKTDRSQSMLTIALSQSGQRFVGHYIQEGIFEYPDPAYPADIRKATAYILGNANGGHIREYVPASFGNPAHFQRGAGSGGVILRFDDIGEFKNGKWIGFSYGQGNGAPGFDGWRGKLTIDGKEFAANIGDSENEHNDVIPGFEGTLFYEDATLDETKHEWDFTLRADNLTLPEGVAGWEGGFAFLHGIFELDISAKLEPLF